MKIKNQIISYFVEPTDQPRVFRSPATMNSDVALDILKEEYDIDPSIKNLMHVCYDCDSKMIYIPNGYKFTKTQKDEMLFAAKFHIVKEFSDFKMTPPIEGSPFSSIRLRSVISFGYVFDAIQKSFPNNFIDIPVVEANLARMPSTVKSLPYLYGEKNSYAGGLVEPKGKGITFFDEIDLKGKKRKEKIRLLSLNKPFILIDTSPSIGSKLTDKEWVVLSGYRDFITGRDGDSDLTNSFASIYAAKRHLYLGWPFEEICNVFLEHISDFKSLMKGINWLLMAARGLEDEGYENPSNYEYYLSFKIDPLTFPFDFKNAKEEIPFFKIKEYDKQSNYIVIKTPAYINGSHCLKILKSKSRPYIVRYNRTINKIDVKSHSSLHKELIMNTSIPSRLASFIKEDLNATDDIPFRADSRSKAQSMSSNQVCHLRSLNDYHYAKDHIINMCKVRNMKFEDIPVVVGPIERIFGRGVQGGFMDKKSFEKNKVKLPFTIERGLTVMPPLIAVNSETMPSYAAQTETLIHEYSHKLYSISNPFHEHLYNKDAKLKDKDPKKYWALYLGDEDEKIAHKEEIKYELKSGKSVDEIIRDKVGGAITKENHKQTYVTALTFKKMVDEAVKEMEVNNGKPISTS